MCHQKNYLIRLRLFLFLYSFNCTSKDNITFNSVNTYNSFALSTSRNLVKTFFCNIYVRNNIQSQLIINLHLILFSLFPWLLDFSNIFQLFLGLHSNAERYKLFFCFSSLKQANTWNIYKILKMHWNAEMIVNFCFLCIAADFL